MITIEYLQSDRALEIRALAGVYKDVENFVNTLYKNDFSFAIVFKLGSDRFALVDPLNEYQLYFDHKAKKFISDYSSLGLDRYNENYKPATSYYTEELAYKGLTRIDPFKLYRFYATGIEITTLNLIKIPSFDSTDTLESVIMERVDRASLGQYDSNEVGIFYSGGFDSACVKTVLNMNGINPVEITLDRLKGEYEPDDTLSYYIGIVQEPFDLGGVVPEIKLFEKAKELGIKVVFDGGGPDELFGGLRKSREVEDNIAYDMKFFWFYSNVKVARIANYFGIKLISPMQNRKFLGLSRSLSWEDRKNKAILRTMATFLPDELRYKPKEPMKNLEFDFRSKEYQDAQIEALFEAKSNS